MDDHYDGGFNQEPPMQGRGISNFSHLRIYLQKQYKIFLAFFFFFLNKVLYILIINIEGRGRGRGPRGRGRGFRTNGPIQSAATVTAGGA